MAVQVSRVDEIVEANAAYAASFTKGDLPIQPSREVAIVTCMDARIEPAAAFGLREGDAHIIRNAGGLVSDDALRSLIISHTLLGTQETLIIGHTDCGMLSFTNDDLRSKLHSERDADASGIDFLPFSDLDEAVRASVRRVVESPLLPDSFRAHGYVYDVASGRLRDV